MSDEVVIVSQNPITREGLSRIIAEDDFEISQSVERVDQVDFSSCSEDAIVLLDVKSDESPAATVASIKKNNKNLRCIVMTDRFDLDCALDCFGQNATGVLLNSISCPPLLGSLRLASLGERIVPYELVEAVRAHSIAPEFGNDFASEDVNLSQRETDVLCCLMAGYSNKIIARRLDVSEATVKVHVKAILRKLKVSNRTQAALWGTANRVTPSPSFLLTAN